MGSILREVLCGTVAELDAEASPPLAAEARPPPAASLGKDEAPPPPPPAPKQWHSMPTAPSDEQLLLRLRQRAPRYREEGMAIGPVVDELSAHFKIDLRAAGMKPKVKEMLALVVSQLNL